MADEEIHRRVSDLTIDIATADGTALRLSIPTPDRPQSSFARFDTTVTRVTANETIDVLAGQMSGERYVVNTPAEYALYWLALNHPNIVREANHFQPGMLASYHHAFDEMRALLKSSGVHA